MDRMRSKSIGHQLSLEAEINALTTIQVKENIEFERGNASLSFASSPLDLPLREDSSSFGRDLQLPNVLLDTYPDDVTR